MKGFLVLILTSSMSLALLGQSTDLQDQNTAKTSRSARGSGQSVVAQKTYLTDAQILNLKGKVKSIEETEYDAMEKDGEIVIRGISKYKMKRVERRQISRTSSYSMYLTDTITEVGFLKNLTFFDSVGNVISSFYYDSLNNARVVWKTRYLSPGMPAEALSYHGTNDRHFGRMLYSYDRRGYLKEQAMYDSLNQLTFSNSYSTQLLNKMSYRYTIETKEKRKLPIYGTIYTTQQRMFTPYTIFTLDEKRNVISEESFWKNSRQLVLREYDDQNRLISLRYYSKKFSEYENPRKIPYLEEHQRRWEYDSAGNALSDWMYTYSYTYDHMGNWIRQAGKSKFGNNHWVTERRIEYY